MSVIVLFSGGIESTYVLHTLRQQGQAVIPLSFNDNAVTYLMKERAAIGLILQHYRLGLRWIESPFLDGQRVPFPGDLYQFVPGYKMLMYVYALAYAQTLGAATIATGYTHENKVFKDEQVEMILKVRDLYAELYGQHAPVADIVHPIYTLSKAEVIRRCVAEQVPVQFTLSCSTELYGGLEHCGTCGCCIRRRQAFCDAGVPDPTVYRGTV
jgi:7-cyano-7-deazaguanine synthase